MRCIIYYLEKTSQFDTSRYQNFVEIQSWLRGKLEGMVITLEDYVGILSEAPNLEWLEYGERATTRRMWA